MSQSTERTGAPRRHSRSPGAWGRRSRFGPGALAVAVATGLAAGAATAASVRPAGEVGTEAVVVGPAVPLPTPDADGAARATTVPPAPTPTPEPSPEPTPEPTPEPEPDPADLLSEADRRAGLLSLAVPASASGELAVVPGSQPAPHPDRRDIAIRVEVEAGLDVDGPTFATMVMEVLNDPRGWGGDGSISFSRTDGPADMRVVLASPQKIDAMCAPLRTRGIYSCGRYGHAALNHLRWVQGTEEFTDMTQYREYLVNHEVGHLLGVQHVPCPGAGRLAPIMQQQTIQVAPCLPNGWPFPDAG